MTFLLISTLLCFFSTSWVIVWVLLEINTLSFCSINFSKPKREFKKTKERIFKYLIVQSIASSILIISSIFKERNRKISVFLITLITLSLITKIAASPLHYWFIRVSKKSSWINNILLFTWQKLIPLYLIIFQLKSILLPFIIISSIVGSIFLLNKKSLKEIIALSSVFNLSWILTAILLNFKILLYFSGIYWLSLVFFIKDITKDKGVYLEEIKNNQRRKFLLFFKSINLAGIPPLIRFLAKWLVFSNLLKVNFMLLPTFLLTLRSINIFIYLRIANKTFIKSTRSKQKNKKQTTNLFELSFLLLNVYFLQIFL